jgi:hypothetical protein
MSWYSDLQMLVPLPARNLALEDLAEILLLVAVWVKA